MDFKNIQYIALTNKNCSATDAAFVIGWFKNNVVVTSGGSSVTASIEVSWSDWLVVISVGVLLFSI